MSDRIQKFIDSLDLKTRDRLKKRLIELRDDPYSRGSDVKKLRGVGKNLYRLRMGDIRVIYKLSDSFVEVVDVDYRGNVY